MQLDDGFERFGVSDLLGLQRTRRAFKFRRGESRVGVLWSACAWGLSLMRLQVSGVRVIRGVSPAGSGIAT